MLRIVTPFALLLLIASAPAQHRGYTDADSPGEAIGMMNMTLITSRTMLRERSARVPDFEDEMYSNLRKWEDVERPAIRKTRYFHGLSVKKDPKLREMDQYGEAVAIKNLETLANGPAPAASQFVSTHCRKYFAELASGVWRERNPRMYKFLDEAPPVPSADAE